MNNMKKNIEKILASAAMIIALVLIIILLVTAFGGIKQEEFDNDLVKGLFITLGILYAVLAGGALAMLFLGSEAVREITLRSEQGGNCKATLGVIRKLVKETFADVEGVKAGKVSLIVNEYGVKLKVAVRITDRDLFETEVYLRTLLEEVFKGALGFRFHAIEIKVTALQSRFKPDKDKVQSAVDERVAEHEPNYASLPNMVEQIAPETAAQESPAEEASADEAADVANAAAEEESSVELYESENTPADAVEQLPEDEAYVEDDAADDAVADDKDDKTEEDAGERKTDADADEE